MASNEYISLTNFQGSAEVVRTLVLGSRAKTIYGVQKVKIFFAGQNMGFCSGRLKCKKTELKKIDPDMLKAATLIKNYMYISRRSPRSETENISNKDKRLVTTSF